MEHGVGSTSHMVASYENKVFSEVESWDIKFCNWPNERRPKRVSNESTGMVIT